MASVTKTITESVDGQKTISLYFASFEDFMKYEESSSDTSFEVNTTIVNNADVCLGEESSVEKPLTELEIGKEYRIIAENHGHEFMIGEHVKVVEFDAYESESPYKAIYLDDRDFWYIGPEEVEEI